MNSRPQPELRFSHLSPARQQLVRICQRLDHGSIRQLHVAGGQPLFQPVPLLHRNRPGAGPRREAALGDFVLKRAFRDLLDALSALEDGVVERIDIHGGLPLRVVVAPAPSDTEEARP